MNVVRSLERSLERLLEGVLGRVFSGRLHASEIAGRIAREADLARFQHASGPATANTYVLTFNPDDIEGDGADLAASLTKSFADFVIESGLRLVGPPQVSIQVGDNVLPGQFLCHPEIVPGEEPTWGRLLSDTGALVISRNRNIIGRSPDADIVVDDENVSRRHALMWRGQKSVWVQDLGSANGTWVDETQLGNAPFEISSGSQLRLASTDFRFLEDTDA